MKLILLFLLIIFSYHNAISQSSSKKKKKNPYELTDDQQTAMIKNIPLKDDKILYDQIIISDSNLSKNKLFIRIRQWFVENFTDSKSVLEVNDSVAGLLTGKGTYKYSNVNGVNLHSGYTSFVMNVAIKDGKFRYQLYTFKASDNNQSLLTTQKNYYVNEINLDEMVALYNKGKREKYARKFLENMADLVYFIQMSLSDLSKQTSSITDF